MSSLRRTLKRSGLPVLLVLCLAALSVSYASADEADRPRAVQIIGDPDAAVTGRFAVGTGSVGAKALTVVGVIDFLGSGAVHNYFTQGAGNNMQINTNVDEANAVGDASRSQWKLVLGSALDWFSIRRSPAGGTYNEDALFFIEGSTGNVGIATVDTSNGAAIPFTPQARLHVQTASGDAVRGIATATTGSANGVYGQSNSPLGFAVHGYASPTTGANYGVLGSSNSLSGYGVAGLAFNSLGTNYGVYGETYSSSGYGVFGSNLFGGYAGYFQGNVHVAGTLTKSAGGFRIDHPLNPANQYLNHSFVESPDMMNLYNGNVALDDSGQAWVQLPDWFEALNQDFRYQLTSIGQFAPLYIAQEVQDNRFLIGGGVPGMLVSWQVTGIRHDPYAEAHRIPVEEDKPLDEQGTFLYPELYGQAASFSLPQLQPPAVEHVRHGEQ